MISKLEIKNYKHNLNFLNHNYEFYIFCQIKPSSVYNLLTLKSPKVKYNTDDEISFMDRLNLQPNFKYVTDDGFWQILFFHKKRYFAKHYALRSGYYF